MQRGAARSNTEIAALERFLLGGGSLAGDLPDARLLRRNNLAGYAYSRLAPGHALRGELEADFVMATAQHLAVRAEVLPLLRAWQGAGVEVLVFKGFYLAEFVYEEPAARFYSDVDILMRPEASHRASRVAQDLGWLESWHEEGPGTIHGHRAPGQREHAVMHLDSTRVRLRLDVHQRILHNKLPWTRVQERFTREAWAASERLPWEDTAIRVLKPADALLIGLVLNRAWSGDDWRLRPHDLLDFRALVERCGLTEDALRVRARELNCARTLELFLRRCNAFEGRLSLRPPSRGERWRWNLAIIPERGHPGLEKGITLALRAPGTLTDMLREFPGVLRVLASLRHQDLLELASSPERVNAMAPAAETRTIRYQEWRSIQRGVRRDLALLGRAPRPGSLLLTLALFFALRRRGCPVVFCSDLESKQEGKLRVWLELDGKILKSQGEAT